ncbi:MAG: hypothetical protein WBV11_10160 [Salegentibacter sp.]
MKSGHKANPQRLPKPTYWPFFLAMGVVFIFWGIISVWVISAAGLIIFSVALGGWITDLYKEIKQEKKEKDEL